MSESFGMLRSIIELFTGIPQAISPATATSMTEGLYEGLEGEKVACECCLAELWLIKVQSWQNFKHQSQLDQKRSVRMTVLIVLGTAWPLQCHMTLLLWVNIAVGPSMFVDNIFSSIVHDPSIHIF